MRLSSKIKFHRSYTLLAFLIPFLGMLTVMAVCGNHPFGTKTALLYSDNYHQYYPFFVAFRRNLLSGDSLLFSWDVGMGLDYMGLIAYYLASPLNLLSVLVPESQLLNYYCMLMPTKLGLAGLFFGLMLKKVFRRDDPSIAFFGGFYALCAWALGYQWNIMWLDTFALLPLVMLGMVSLLEEKRFILYTAALALSVGANYYIGFFTCIFVFLVFFCYEICRFGGWKKFFADLCRIAFFSVLAIGMTAVLTLSAFSALQSTQSSVNKFPTTFRLNMTTDHTIMGLLDAMRKVAGNMGGGLEPTFKEGLPNLYCGVGSILLGVLFLMAEDVKLRDKLCSLFLLLFFNVSFIIRQLDYVWHGFHFPNMIPYRFSFLYSFVLLYMAYRAWLNRRKYGRLQIVAAGFLTAAIICCADNLTATQDITLGGTTRQVPVYIIYNAFFLVLYMAVLLWGSWKVRVKEPTEEALFQARRTLRRRRMHSGTAFFVAAALELSATLTAFGCFFPSTGVSNYPKGTTEAASMIRYLHEREADTLFYRTETDHSQTLNDGALNDYWGVSAFTSSANVRITEFMRAFGYGAKNTYNRYCFEESSPVPNLFLNLKYMIDRDGKDKTSTFFQEVHHFGKVGLYRNTAYLPLGFLVEPELAEIDFMRNGNVFTFQNDVFRAATGIPADVWQTVAPEYREINGSGTVVSDENGSGYCAYSAPEAGANVIYSYVVNRDGFACVHLDLPKRNDFYVSVNGTELYRETISLPQMLAVGDVKSGDIVDIRILCKEGESGTATVNLGLLDNAMFLTGYARLAECPLELTSFSNILVEGQVDCLERTGLLYTSVPQNGGWKAYVDGEPAEITLVGNCMVSVPLSEGTHTVRLEYDNQAFRIGLTVTGGCVAVFVLLILLSMFRRKEAPTAKPEDEPAPEHKNLSQFVTGGGVPEQMECAIMCPVCGSTIRKGEVCRNCGHDDSANLEHYGTLSPSPGESVSLHTQRMRYSSAVQEREESEKQTDTDSAE